MHDNESEFIIELLELLVSYSAKSALNTIETLRLNIVERMHEILGDMIRREKFKDNKNLMKEVDILLSICAWAL